MLASEEPRSTLEPHPKAVKQQHETLTAGRAGRLSGAASHVIVSVTRSVRSRSALPSLHCVALHRARYDSGPERNATMGAGNPRLNAKLLHEAGCAYDAQYDAWTRSRADNDSDRRLDAAIADTLTEEQLRTWIAAGVSHRSTV